MTRRNRRRQRSFEDTFDNIMTATIALMCLIAALGFGAAFYMLYLMIQMSMNGVPFN